MQKFHQLFAFSAIALACATSAFAVTPVNLKDLPASSFKNLTTTQSSFAETSRHVDFNGTSHIRVQQMYLGHPVWGADAVVHVPQNTHAALNALNANTTMNGVAYQDLNKDLSATPAFAFAADQAQRALKHGLELHHKATGVTQYDHTKTKSNLIVFVDKENKAHWAYMVSFFSGMADNMPAVPTFIMDAATFNVYAEWNDLQTLDDVDGGGFGGNPKMGKLSYDGTDGHYPSLKITRDSAKKICYLGNDDVIAKDDTDSSGPFSDSPTAEFKCSSKDSKHNNLYWSGDKDATNGAYSPANDSMYIGSVIKDMYQNWYGVPALSIFGMPLALNLHAHAKDMTGQPMDNAYFLSFTMQMYFGDGVKLFYPLTSLGVGAHEISHGFTSQHSNLAYEKQSGGLNESYSDMAAQAAEYYSTGTNSWQIGPEIVKGTGALRYMDDPTKDGKSIAHVKNYTDDLNVHYSSGVFNKVFYLLGTSKNWNTRKAFDVMVKANMDYWTANSTFADAACGVKHAADDYKYSAKSVASALKKVGLDVSKC